jgi:cGMP-dependent protein kinase 1
LIKYNDQYFALKQMSKARIRAKGLKSHVYWEKHVMLECNSPFTVNLVETFQVRLCIHTAVEPEGGGWRMKRERKRG